MAFKKEASINYVARQIDKANTHLRRAYERLVACNERWQFDYATVAPDAIGLEQLLPLVRKIERLYYQE